MAKGKRLFQLRGQFQGFTSDKKPRSFQLQTQELSHRIKAPKSLRAELQQYLQPGDAIQVDGVQTVDKDTAELQLKAKKVTRITAAELMAAPVATPVSKPAKSAKVLVCHKSSCRKRGAVKVYQALEASLSEAGLDGTVPVKLTGCMDRCKAGPNVVVMPGKHRYTKVASKQASDVVHRHFTES